MVMDHFSKSYFSEIFYMSRQFQKGEKNIALHSLQWGFYTCCVCEPPSKSLIASARRTNFSFLSTSDAEKPGLTWMKIRVFFLKFLLTPDCSIAARHRRVRMQSENLFSVSLPCFWWMLFGTDMFNFLAAPPRSCRAKPYINVEGSCSCCRFSL